MIDRELPMVWTALFLSLLAALLDESPNFTLIPWWLNFIAVLVSALRMTYLWWKLYAEA